MKNTVVGGVFEGEDSFAKYMQWIKDHGYTYNDSFKDEVLEEYFYSLQKGEVTS